MNTNNIIFTDIDGVLNTNSKNQYSWNENAVYWYNRLIEEFDLKVVISSTWRLNYSISQLQQIFDLQGVNCKIYDYTPILYEDRGLEIENWLCNNHYTNFVILDDNVKNIVKYGLPNIVKCETLLGLTEKEFLKIKEIYNTKFYYE